MQLRNPQPTITPRQIALAAGMIAAAAGIGLAVGSNRFDLALAGIVIFSLAAWAVCTLENIR